MTELCRINSDPKIADAPTPTTSRTSNRSATIESSAKAAVGPTKRKGNWKKGPGRGHIGPMTKDPPKCKPCPVAAEIAKAKNAVLNSNQCTKAQLVTQVKNMVSVATNLKRKVQSMEQQRDAFAAMVMNAYDVQSTLGEQEIKRRKTLAAEALGEGYKSESTFKKHRMHAIGVIKSLCGPTIILMQTELAEALHQHYHDPSVFKDSIAAQIPSNQEDAHDLAQAARDAVIAGIKDLLSELRRCNKGRYTTEARIASECILSAAMYKRTDMKVTGCSEGHSSVASCRPTCLVPRRISCWCCS